MFGKPGRILSEARAIADPHRIARVQERLVGRRQLV
jgi:hypothetical protein